MSVEGNARLTGSTAAVLLVLLAAEGATIPFVGPQLGPHVVIGLVLVPPVLVKMGAAGWRFVRYYAGDAEYVRRGPPPALLRLAGPAVVVLTVAVFASGIGLLFAGGHALGSQLRLVHKASFVLWFGAMAVHVLGHVVDTARLAPRDWVGRARRDVAGAGRRQWLLVASLVAGVLLAVGLAGRASWYRSHRVGAGAGLPAKVQPPAP